MLTLIDSDDAVMSVPADMFGKHSSLRVVILPDSPDHTVIKIYAGKNYEESMTTDDRKLQSHTCRMEIMPR